MPVAIGEYTSGIEIKGSWLHFKGFEVRNVQKTNRVNTAVSISGDAFHVIIEQFDIHHNSGSGLSIRRTLGGHEIINCDSHDNENSPPLAEDRRDADGFGVHDQETGDVTRFTGYRAWWNSDDGWDFFSQEVSVVVENCWAYGNG